MWCWWCNFFKFYSQRKSYMEVFFSNRSLSLKNLLFSFLSYERNLNLMLSALDSSDVSLHVCCFLKSSITEQGLHLHHCVSLFIQLWPRSNQEQTRVREKQAEGGCMSWPIGRKILLQAITFNFNLTYLILKGPLLRTSGNIVSQCHQSD